MMTPLMFGCPYLFDPLCFSHFGEDPRTYPDFTTKLAEVRAEAESSNCCLDNYISRLSVGNCGNSGIQFISESTGFGGTTYYFRADGEFLALAEYTDFPLPPCFGSREWPRKVNCTNPETTETICDFGDCVE